MKKHILNGLLFLSILLSSCSISKKISRPAKDYILNNEAFVNAHTGISIYEPATGNYWYNYQGDKYFVPASNTKLATCYAAMKYLGDSLIGLRYRMENKYVNFIGTGDPTFLDPEFKNQPVFDFLKKSSDVNYLLDGSTSSDFTPLGRGWSWDDYLGDYAAERSEMPIYGNVVKFYMQADTVAVMPSFFYNESIQWNNGILRNGGQPYFKIVRPFEVNSFYTLSSSQMYRTRTKFTSQFVPFKTFSKSLYPRKRTFIKLLEDTLHKTIGDWSLVDAPPRFQDYSIIHSQPTDSLLKPMMHRSDNFFAEQSLLMVSNVVLGTMNDQKIIDTLLKTDFKSFPQKPGWVDGSGLSRYNLFSPIDFVFILNKMKNDFGMERIKNILQTGGTGTISNYYREDRGYIFVKTGTLNGVVALSGFFIYEKK
jgi:D-alanyl-D-alanine carboxypeptidase/D-alanyl-D-alanine-endopeptidase (penicillin-binding protein 4)